MKLIRVKDNSRTKKEEFEVSRQLVNKIADKTLLQLEREGIFVFPELIKESDDLDKDQKILQSIDDSYSTGNVMGFLGLGNERLIISSRFSLGGEDYLFQYLLQKVLDRPNVIDLNTDANPDQNFFDMLVFLFPHYLKLAVRKGLYKTYSRKYYNDGHVKGTIEIPRHIAKNTPFIGNVAYSQREYSCDNSLMELVRHTIEFIKRKPYGKRLLNEVKEEISLIISATQTYELYDRGKIIAENKRNPIRHAYYREYRALQCLCILILQHQKNRVGSGSRQIYGILFDGAWLWEEYINQLIQEGYYHPMNKARREAQKLFGSIGSIYPDFIGRKAENRIIADAKYKPLDNIHGQDYLQILAYMLRFDARKGIYLYPEAGDSTDMELYLNQGMTYEKNVVPRTDIMVVKHGLKIPTSAKSYEEFTAMMLESETQFKLAMM